MRYLLIAVISITLLGCGGAEERKTAYLEKARVSIDSGELDKARIELKNVLQIDPKFAPAYFELGKIFEAQQEYRKAYNSYSKAVNLDETNFEYLAKVGRFQLLLSNDIEAATEKNALDSV